MPERISKTQRWLDLITYLVGRRLPVAVDEIMEGVPAYAEKWRTGEATACATARRTFERDKDELRAAGFPIETVTYSVGPQETEGYRLSRRDFYLPYLRLVSTPTAGRTSRGTGDAARVSEVEIVPEEARTARDALRRMASLPASPFAEEARSALRKLSFDLDLVSAPDTPILALDRPGSAEVVEQLRVLSDALLARKGVRFTYRGMHREAPTAREVFPYGLFFTRDWYLVGHDRLRDAIRVFRVARMEALERQTAAPKAPDYEVPADFRLEDYLGRDAWNLGSEDEGVAVVVRFHFPLSLWAARNAYGELVEECADGAALRRFTVHQTSPFVRWRCRWKARPRSSRPASSATSSPLSPAGSPACTRACPMPERDTADAQLGRILALLPLAARAEGVRTAELARELGTSESQLLRDLEEVYTRAYYHPAGGGDDPQVLIEHDRISVWTKGEFRRPVRLLPREALALHLGLALLARESGDDAERDALLGLGTRLEAQLASVPAESLLPHVAVDSGAGRGERVHAVLAAAARERHSCRIRYLKPGAEPETRTIDPYLLVAAEGTWYTIGRCHREDAARTFRLDRVLEAAATGGAFEVPADFDPGPFTAMGRVFRAEADTEAQVRYSPAIARWISERSAVDPDGDGSVVLRHRVADPRWIVRHVLQYGADARVEAPAEFQALVRDTAARMAAAPG